MTGGVEYNSQIGKQLHIDRPTELLAPGFKSDFNTCLPGKDA